MKYLVSVSREALASRYAELLLKEIDRFDFRASFFLYRTHLHSSKDFRNEVTTLRSKKDLASEPDVILRIGTTADFKLVKAFPNTTKRYFFQISENYENALKANKKAVSLYSKVFTDLPFFQKDNLIDYPGHFLTDIVRINRQSSSEGNQSSKTMVAIICSTHSEHRRAQQITKNSKGINWIVVGPERKKKETSDYLDACLQAIRLSNVVVVFSDIHELMAAFMSCPAVRVAERRFFKKPSQSIISRIVEKDCKLSTSGKSSEVAKAIYELLNDHQICAERLSRYQQAIEKLGANPVFRNLGQELVEGLESDGLRRS